MHAYVHRSACDVYHSCVRLHHHAYMTIWHCMREAGDGQIRTSATQHTSDYHFFSLSVSPSGFLGIESSHTKPGADMALRSCGSVTCRDKGQHAAQRCNRDLRIMQTCHGGHMPILDDWLHISYPSLWAPCSTGQISLSLSRKSSLKSDIAVHVGSCPGAVTQKQRVDNLPHGSKSRSGGQHKIALGTACRRTPCPVSHPPCQHPTHACI